MQLDACALKLNQSSITLVIFSISAGASVVAIIELIEQLLQTIKYSRLPDKESVRSELRNLAFKFGNI